MSILREILVRGLRSEALNRMVHLTHANTLTVLCYHGVVEQRLGPEHHRFLTTVSASDFAEQIEWLPGGADIAKVRRPGRILRQYRIHGSRPAVLV